MKKTWNFSFDHVRSRAGWKRQRRAILKRTLGIIGESPVRVPSLGPTIFSEEKLLHYIRRKVSYAVEPNERVNAWLLIPRSLPRVPRSTRLPAVLCLHQTISAGKDGPVGLADDPNLHYAHELTLRGYVTLTPDHVAAGERRPPGLETYDTAVFYQRHPQWSAVGKSIWDTSRALDYLLTLRFVDPKRIGSIGHSLGAHSTAFAMVFDPRIAAGVANCGITTFAADPNRLKWCRDHWYIYMPRLRPIFLAKKKAPFDFHEIMALITPRPFLNISALNDRFVANVESVNEALYAAQQIYKLHKADHKLAGYFHWQEHSFLPPSRALAYAWLDRWLKS